MTFKKKTIKFKTSSQDAVADVRKKKVNVACLFLEDGPFLHDKKTGKLYTTKKPHAFVRMLDLDTESA
jgi:hypothetical protein